MAFVETAEIPITVGALAWADGKNLNLDEVKVISIAPTGTPGGVSYAGTEITHGGETITYGA